MSIRDVLQSAAKKLIGRAPSTFFDSSQPFEIQLCDWANEVARDIAQYHDWQQLIRTRTFYGDGVTTDFPFPNDYDRMTLVGRMQDDSYWAWGYSQVYGVDNFLALQTEGFGPFPGVWTIYDNKFHFYPAPPAGQQATFTYISNNWALDGGTPKDKFTRDTDEFLLSDETLMLGILWRYRENKGLDPAGAQEAFTLSLDEHAGKDKGPFVIRRNGGSRLYRNTYPAWPWPLGGA